MERTFKKRCRRVSQRSCVLVEPAVTKLRTVVAAEPEVGASLEHVNLAHRSAFAFSVRVSSDPIQDSVHKLLGNKSKRSDSHEIRGQQASIRGVNGSEFIFSGLRSNATKIKSMKDSTLRGWKKRRRERGEWAILIPPCAKRTARFG